jgi:hypothetical protein
MSTDDLMTLVRLTPSPDVAARWYAYVKHHLPIFRNTLNNIPLVPGPGSISTAEAFWLFRLISELQPSAVVDSGSATGWSAFVIASAAPNAEIYCFDPYRRPELLPPKAHYQDADFTHHRRFPSGTVALFDDHVNQRRRVLQARRAGIRNVLFHDVYRELTKSVVSLLFADLIGLVERAHIFEPLWHVDPIFTDTATNPQMYRWLTWLQLTSSGWSNRPFIVRSAAQRYRLRNPAANEQARKNWRAR